MGTPSTPKIKLAARRAVQLRIPRATGRKKKAKSGISHSRESAIEATDGRYPGGLIVTLVWLLLANIAIAKQAPLIPVAR
jgi:hypothetical protein